MVCPGATSTGGGSTVSQIVSARWQRLRKRQPDRMLSGGGARLAEPNGAAGMLLKARVCRQQERRVRVSRSCEQVLRVANFDNPAQVHDRDPLGHLRDDRGWWEMKMMQMPVEDSEEKRLGSVPGPKHRARLPLHLRSGARAERQGTARSPLADADRRHLAWELGGVGRQSPTASSKSATRVSFWGAFVPRP